MPPSYDFYSPFMSAAILLRTGQRIPLWVVQGHRAATPTMLEQRDRPYVQEVSVKLVMSGTSEMTAKLTPTYEAGLEFLNTTLVEWGNSVLEILMGYSTGGTGGGAVLGPRYTGLIVQPDIQIGSEISVTVKANGADVFNLNTTGTTETVNGHRREIIEYLLRGDPQNPTSMQLDLSLIDGTDSELWDAYFFDQFSIPLGGKTYWQHISTLVWETRCWMYTDGNTVRVLPRSFSTQQAPKYILAVFNFGTGGVLGPLAGVFPILSASSPTLGAYLPGALAGIAVPGTDPHTRQTVNTEQSDRTAPEPRVDSGNSRPNAGNRAVSPSQRRLPIVNTSLRSTLPIAGNRAVRPTRTRTPAPTPAPVPPDTATPAAASTAPTVSVPAGQQVIAVERSEGAESSQMTAARAEWAASSSGVGIQLELETLGIPDLAPGDVVMVQGLGIRVDGKYMILEATHTMSSGGLTTKLTGVKNVGSALQAGATVIGPINRHVVTPANNGPADSVAAARSQLDVLLNPRRSRRSRTRRAPRPPRVSGSTSVLAPESVADLGGQGPVDEFGE